MKVLFVSSGNSKMGISPIIKNQAISLTKYISDLEIDYYCIKGKGIKGYVQNIIPLKKQLRQHSYDIIHAHYSLSAFCASLAGAKPLIVSLMGSDVKANMFYRLLIRFFAFLFNWRSTIVKSQDMKNSLGQKKAYVIPNGVDMDMFQSMPQRNCQAQLGWNDQKKHILFPANPNRYEKNYILTVKAIELLNYANLELHCFENVPHIQTPIWYNAADIIVLTSLWEGSPNAIKEAMACNKTMVTTNVGDIEWLFGKEPGHFLTTFEPEDVAEKIQKALFYSQDKKHTDGRDRLIVLKLDAVSIANKIYNLYYNNKYNS